MNSIGLANSWAAAQVAVAACLGLFLSLAGTVPASHARDSSYVYAVQLSAAVRESPPQILLSWPPDPYGAISYTVYRKSKGDAAWGAPLAILSGDAISFADTNVLVGSAWEYQVVKASQVGYQGFGYIYAGIRAPLIEDRGALVLIVETGAAAALIPELARLQSDLVGDGWQVLPHTAPSNAAPETVRALIAKEYAAAPDRVRAVFLFGHVPILQSGQVNYDGHEVRPMAADAYYADMDVAWATDPALSPGFLPSDVELMVGRVDLADMPGQGAPAAWPSEIDLLRNYLEKDHLWRHKRRPVPRRALVGNLRGDEGGQACAASGYRNFQPFVGPGNVFDSNVDYGAPVEELWISRLGAEAYLWAYACGAGIPNGVSGMGTNVYNFVYGTDLVAVDAKAVFFMMFGSWFGNWDCRDNFLRAVLATPTLGLTACMAGRPHWFLHHMALGEPIGYATHLTMNNQDLYRNHTNAFTRAVYSALMGDPTLRLDPVASPSAAAAAGSAGGVELTWEPSPDASIGYHVYRSANPRGPFSRITPDPVSGTRMLDPAPPAGELTYMIRAIDLEEHFSGSYFNPSQGVFASVSVPPTRVWGEWLPAEGFRISWETAPDRVYRVWATPSLHGESWALASVPIAGTGATVSWTDAGALESKTRFYRVSVE